MAGSDAGAEKSVDEAFCCDVGSYLNRYFRTLAHHDAFLRLSMTSTHAQQAHLVGADKTDLIALRDMAQHVGDDARKNTALQKTQAKEEAEAEFWRNAHSALWSGELGALHYTDKKNEVTRCFSKSGYQSIARANILSPQTRKEFSHLAKYHDLELLVEGYLSVGWVDAKLAQKWSCRRRYPCEDLFGQQAADASEPSAAAGIPSAAKPKVGRPPLIKGIFEQEFRERRDRGEVQEGLSDEARAINTALGGSYNEGTIRNEIGPYHRVAFPDSPRRRKRSAQKSA